VVANLGSGRGAAVQKLCPNLKGCKCSKDKGGGSCVLEAQCKGWKVFPTPENYPEGLDCMYVDSPALEKLSKEEKEKGIQAIPASMRRLDLSGSRLKELPESGFGHLKELRVLNLEFNMLEVLPEKTFHGLSHLKVIWLTGNHYQKDEPEYKKMKAAGNNLKELHPGQFKTCIGLQILLMHHNKLVTLPATIFEDQKKLRVVKMLDNPFKPKILKTDDAFKELLSSKVLHQLDINKDSGDSLEDEWEKAKSYLSDDFSPGAPAPKKKKKGKAKPEL